jgi:hypothetical protein
MTQKPRLLVLNGTCLDVLENHKDWLGTLQLDIIADPKYRHMDLKDADEVLSGADALILPTVINTTAQCIHKLCGTQDGS